MSSQTQMKQTRLTQKIIIYRPNLKRQYFVIKHITDNIHDLNCYTQTKKTLTLKIFLECLLCFVQSQARPCNCRKMNGFLSHGIGLVLHLFRNAFILTYKNTNCYFFLSESHMCYGSEKCVSGLWIVATAL